MSSSTEPEWSLQPAAPADEHFMRVVYASTREDEEPIRSWPKAQRDRFLAMQYEAQRDSYASSYPEARISLIFHGRKPVGRLIVNETAGELRVVDIALLRAHRRKGIGRAVLTQLLADAEAKGMRVSLHVLAGSPAARLYERLGFEERPSASPGRRHLVREPRGR